MNAIVDFDSALSGRLCLTLLHSIWQFALLAIITLIVARLWRRRNADTEYAISVAALLLGLVAMPITFSLVQIAAPVEIAIVDAIAMPTEPALSVQPEPVVRHTQWDEVAHQVTAEEHVPVQPVTARDSGSAKNSAISPTVASTASLATNKFDWKTLTTWLTVVYLAGVILMLGRLAFSILKINALAAQSMRVKTGVFAELIQQLGEAWSMRILPALAVAENAVVPKVIGILSPTILLPASAVTGLTVDELKMILVHELAHVRRHDMLLNLVQRLAEVVLFFNPALWFLSRRISILREYCCDELACKTLESDCEIGASVLCDKEKVELRTRYAIALMRVVEMSLNGPQPAKLTSLAASGRSPSELRRRVARLFGEPLREPIRLSRKSLLAFAFASILLLAGPAIWHSKAQSESLENDTSSALVSTTANAEEDQEESPSSKRYQTDAGEIEVSIAMQKPEIMLGEPATMIVTVKNLAAKQLFLARDQDRVLGRPTNFKMTATDSDGKVARTRETGQIREGSFGGMSWKEEIPAGESWSGKFFLPDWFSFNETGKHLVNCKATLQFNSSDFDENRRLETAEVNVSLSVPVTIVPNSMEKMALLIEELGSAALADKPDDYAMKQLLAIDDNGVVEQLLKAVAMQNYSIRFSALQGLSKFSTDDALRGIEIGLATSVEDMRKNSSNDKVAGQLVKNIRHSASVALSNSPHPKAEERLLSLWNDPNYAIRVTVLHRLGSLKTDESMETLKKMTRDNNEVVRDEAIRYVKLREESEEVDEKEEKEPQLSGRIVDENDNPLHGVKVVLYSGIATRKRGQETETDKEGKYRFDPVKTGDRTTADDGTTHWYTGVQFTHDDYVPADGKSWRDVKVLMKPGHDEILNLKMMRGGKVAGIVKDDKTGEPMKELDLRIHNGQGRETGTYLVYATTDDAGHFTSEALPAGKYTVEINDGSFRGDQRYPKIGQVEVKAGATAKVDLLTLAMPQLPGPFAGISIRLLPLASINLNSAPPLLAFETKREGDLDLILSEVNTAENRIEIDGEVYVHPGLPITAEHQGHFRSVKDTIIWQNVPGPRIVMDGQWKSIKDGKPLKLTSGKHAVRFGWGGFHPLEGEPEQPDKKRPALVWSNAAELIVIDYAEVAIAFNSGVALLDLDSGKTIGPIARGAPSDVPQFDLFASHGVKGTILAGQLHKLVKVDNELWSKATAKSIGTELAKQEEAKRNVAQQLAQEGDKTPSTWLVETKQDGVAILQVEFRDDIKTEFSGIVNGFMVKYRLISAEPDEKADDADQQDDQESSVTRKMTIRVVDAEGDAIKGARVFRNHVYQPADADRPKIENETYTTDMGGAAEIELSGETVDLRIWVSAKGFAPLHAMWAEKFQSDGSEIPDEFTFKMLAATSIGGIITDEAGKPIEGVKVEVIDTAAQLDNSVRPDRPGKRPVRTHRLTGDDGILTDKEGRWSLHNVPPDEVLADDLRFNRKLQLRITHVDHFGDDNPTDDIQRSQGITHESLRDQTAKIVLKSRKKADEPKFGIRWPAEWISTVTIDTRFVNEPMIELVSSEVAEKQFTKDGKLNEEWAAAIDWSVVPDLDTWKQAQNDLLAAGAKDPRDVTPLVSVVRFSRKHVEVKVLRPFANYRWVHYFGVAKHLLIGRSETVDSMFGLNQLEAQYLMAYKGVGRGTGVQAAREKLGEPDYTQHTQSPGWYHDYYFDDNVDIFYQNQAIHSITREIPDSIKEAADELRAKDATDKTAGGTDV